MHASYNLVVLVRGVEEYDSAVAQTHCNCVVARTKFNSQNHTHTRDVFFPLHCTGSINSNKSHVLLEKNHLVYLLEVKYFFDVVVVGCLILDVYAFGVAHVAVALSIPMSVFDLVLNQVSGQLLKLNSFARSLLCSVKEID